MLPANADQGFIVHHLANGQWHVAGYLNAQILRVLDHLTVSQKRVHFHLIGEQGGVPENVLRLIHLRAGEVGNADVLGQTFSLGVPECAEVFAHGDFVIR